MYHYLDRPINNNILHFFLMNMNDGIVIINLVACKLYWKFIRLV